MVGLRIEGTEQEISETLRRVRAIATIVSEPKFYDSRTDSNKKLAYVRVYFYERDSLFDQLEAALHDSQELEETIGALERENAELRRRLGEGPRPWDAVLGGNNRPD